MRMRTEELDSESKERVMMGDSRGSSVPARGVQFRAGLVQSSIGWLKGLLLENRGWTQILIRNAFWAAAAESIVRLLKILQVLLVVRYFGPTDYGKLSFAFSFATMFSIIFDSGLLVAATREFAVDRENEKRLLDVIAMKIVLGAVGMLSVAAGAYWITRDQDIRAIIVILGLYVFLSELVNSFCAVFRARQRMELESYIRTGNAALLLAAIGVVLWKAPSVLGIGWAYAASSLVTVAIVGGASLRGRWQFRFKLRWDVWRRFFRTALPLGCSGAVMILYGNLDSVLLGHWGKITETGWYNVANKMNAMTLLPMSLVWLVTLPAFAPGAGAVDDTFRRRWDKWTTWMLALGLLFGVLILVTAEPLVELAFGPAFRPAGAALQILIISAVLMYIYTPCYQAMIMFGQTMKLFWALLSGGIVNVILNAAFIPRYGLYAAAWALVATHLVILGALFVFVARCTPIRPINRAFCSALLSSATSAGLAYLAMKMAPASLWVTAPLGTLVFAAAFVGLRRASEGLVARSGLFSIGNP